MAKQPVTKQVTEMNITFFDNGFTIYYDGKNNEDDWAETRMVLTSIDEVCEHVRKVAEFPK